MRGTRDITIGVPSAARVDTADERAQINIIEHGGVTSITTLTGSTSSGYAGGRTALTVVTAIEPRHTVLRWIRTAAGRRQTCNAKCQ